MTTDQLITHVIAKLKRRRWIADEIITDGNFIKWMYQDRVIAFRTIPDMPTPFGKWVWDGKDYVHHSDFSSMES